MAKPGITFRIRFLIKIASLVGTTTVKSNPGTRAGIQRFVVESMRSWRCPSHFVATVYQYHVRVIRFDNNSSHTSMPGLRYYLAKVAGMQVLSGHLIGAIRRSLAISSGYFDQ